jgi:hypothetical protein
LDGDRIGLSDHGEAKRLMSRTRKIAAFFVDELKRNILFGALDHHIAVLGPEALDQHFVIWLNHPIGAHLVSGEAGNHHHHDPPILGLDALRRTAEAEIR